MAGHIFFVHTPSQKRCKTNLVLFFFLILHFFCMPVYFLIYIDYNEPFFDSDNGGFGDIFRKKIS